MRSVMAHQWDKVPMTKYPRSVFNRSCGYKTTFNSGFLYPIFSDEVFPGDTFKVRATFFARLQTMFYPIMDNIFLDSFWFFVPFRLLWEHWEQFQGAVDPINLDPSPTEYLTPVMGHEDDEQVPVNGMVVTEKSLGDYLGLPITGPNPSEGDYLEDISAFYHRAYTLIYNEWFRDQNLISPITVDKGDGPDVNVYPLQRRGKRKDYFTSCLPWPQKGPAIELPVGVSAPVIGNGLQIGFDDGTNSFGIMGIASNPPTFGPSTGGHGEAVGHTETAGGQPNSGGIGLSTNDNYSGMIADLSAATAPTINSIRQAFQLQRLLERDARGGTRYVEMLKSQWGVTAPDFRLQRPELLCTSSARINVHPVQQTSASVTGSPQGKLAAFGTIADSSASFNKGFVEHGLIMGIVNVRADLTYQRGVERRFTRRTRFDYPMPVLAGLGEQEVLQQEIMWVPGSADNKKAFGYIPRFDELRYKQSLITSTMRSTATDSLDIWHLSQDLAENVTLNQTFIEEDPPIDRVVAVQDEDQIIFDSYFDITCAREFPVYGVPGLVDHF